MGKSFTREDGLMIDSSAIAMDSSGHSLENALIHMSNITLSDATATTGGYSTTVSDARINEKMRIINADLTGEGNLLTDISWTTSEGQVIFTYNINTGTTATIDFDLIQFT